MNYRYLIIIFIIVLVYLLYTQYLNFNEIRYIKSDIDGITYMIRRGNNKTAEFLKESADTLAMINIRIEKLIKYLVDKYKNDTTKYYFIKKLKENYSSYMISEAAIDPRYTTYTIDKNDLHVCLRTRDTNEQLYDINTLMYVILHELGHYANYTPEGIPIMGHGSQFKYIFSFLTQEAINIGIYQYKNYHLDPKEYCGIKINSSILN